MNSEGYYQNPIFPGIPTANITPGKEIITDYDSKKIEMTPLNLEQSYIENILLLNNGKKAKLHVTVPGSNEFKDKVFEGIIEQSGIDYIIMSNPNGEWYLILLIYLDFITFDESINFIKDFK